MSVMNLMKIKSVTSNIQNQNCGMENRLIFATVIMTYSFIM